MLKICCYTSITYSYLDRARVLAESVKKHHPDWEMCLLLSDDPPPGVEIDWSSENFDRVINSNELGIKNWLSWRYGHDIVELCTAVKGPTMAKLLSEEFDAVIYLDPDTTVFAPLVHVLEMLQDHAVVLTPHLVDQELSTQGILDNEIGSLKHGVYNLGFVAVRNVAEGRRFGDWWRDRLLEYCQDDVPNGLFTDQRWCDLVPALFDGVGVLRNSGYNAASWNLATRPIRIDAAGRINAGRHPLRFFHFTKVSSAGEMMLERYAYGHTEVFELLRWYRTRLTHHQLPGLPTGWWAYGAYADGEKIPKPHRLTWRVRGDVREYFENPYASGPGSYQEWCRNTGL